jgi:hypothetical protein
MQPISSVFTSPVRLLDADDPDFRGQCGMSPLHFEVGWCGVGGERGGDIVPRWFGVLTELGIRRVNLFWALPAAENPTNALERVRSISVRWLAELRGLGVDAALSIKRGEPGPWLAGLASLNPDSVIVTGPPAWRGASSSTIRYLLENRSRSLLLLPDLIQTPDVPLFACPVIDAPTASAARSLAAAKWDGHPAEFLDLEPLDPVQAVRTALRVAEDVDASVLVLPRRSHLLVPYALNYGNFPVLIPPSPASTELQNGQVVHR